FKKFLIGLRFFIIRLIRFSGSIRRLTFQIHPDSRSFRNSETEPEPPILSPALPSVTGRVLSLQSHSPLQISVSDSLISIASSHYLLLHDTLISVNIQPHRGEPEAAGIRGF
ncbi:hypothetical protein LINPERHAP2_LOCUS23580, partial [Linum perenne]